MSADSLVQFEQAAQRRPDQPPRADPDRALVCGLAHAAVPVPGGSSSAQAVAFLSGLFLLVRAALRPLPARARDRGGRVLSAGVRDARLRRAGTSWYVALLVLTFGLTVRATHGQADGRAASCARRCCRLPQPGSRLHRARTPRLRSSIACILLALPRACRSWTDASAAWQIGCERSPPVARCALALMASSVRRATRALGRARRGPPAAAATSTTSPRHLERSSGRTCSRRGEVLRDAEHADQSMPSGGTSTPLNAVHLRCTTAPIPAFRLHRDDDHSRSAGCVGRDADRRPSASVTWMSRLDLWLRQTRADAIGRYGSYHPVIDPNPLRPPSSASPSPNCGGQGLRRGLRQPTRVSTAAPLYAVWACLLCCAVATRPPS